MHTLLDLQDSIPVFIDITDGLSQDVNILDRITVDPGAFYVMDMACRRVYSRAVDKGTGLKYDRTVALTGHCSKKRCPEHLRRVKFLDHLTGKTFVFLTNNFELAVPWT